MQVVASANHNEKQSLPALALSMLLGSHLSTFAWKATCFAEPTIDEASTHGELCFIFGNVQNCKLPTCLILFNVIFYLYCTRENYKPVCKLIYIYIHIYKLYTYLCCLQLLHIDMFSALECLRCLFDAHGSTPHRCQPLCASPICCVFCFQSHLQNFGAGISAYFDLGVIVQPCSARFWNIGIFHGIYNNQYSQMLHGAGIFTSSCPCPKSPSQL